MSINAEVLFETKPPQDAVRAVLDSAEAIHAIASTSRAVTPKDWSTVAGHLARNLSSVKEETSSPRSRALVALCARMIESGNKKAVERAILLLWVYLPPTPGGAAAVVPLLRSDPDWRSLPDIYRAFVRHPDAADHLDVLREREQSADWRAAVAARHTLEQLSQTVAPYRYEGFFESLPNPSGTGLPWVEDCYASVLEELSRLGGSVKIAAPASGHLRYYSSARKQGWSDADPLGEIPVPSGVLWNVYDGLHFEAEAFTYAPKGQDKRQLAFMSPSENFDTEVEGRRRLLAPIAYCESTQFHYCVDLSGRQPGDTGISIWSIDHDGTGPRLIGSLSDFLKALRPNKKR